METEALAGSREISAVDLTFVALLMQGAIGLFGGLTMLIIAAVTGSVGLLGLSLPFALGWPALAIGLGTALVRRHQLARRALLIYQALAILGWLVSVPTSRGVGFALVPLTTGALLPAGVIVLLFRRDVRASLAAKGKAAHRSATAETPHRNVA